MSAEQHANGDTATNGIRLNFLDQSTNDTQQEESAVLAKEYTLDIPRIPSVEFPLHVSAKPESIKKAVNMCGGITQVKEMLKKNADPETENYLELYLNKQDNKNEETDSGFFNEHPIVGKPVPFRDNSVILKVVMPKGTMKKHNNNVQKSLASLKGKDYKITPVAVVDNTIKFREMSDFQYHLDNVPAANEYISGFGSLEWSKLKPLVESIPDNDTMPQENISKLIFNRSLKSPSSDYQLPPPPRLSMIGFPHLYKYKKNPLAVKKANGASEVKGSYIKNYQLFLHTLDDASIPTEPHPSLQKDYNVAKEEKVYPGTKKSSKFYESLEECLALLEKLFEKRPIWIKRHLDGIIPKRIHHTLKIALALVTYRFTMGPWRNTYIKFGCDPRSSSEYAKYQTEYFKIERKLLSSSTVRKNIPKLKEIVFESNIPGDIDTRFRFDGNQIPWYLMLQIDLLVYETNVAEIFEKVEYLDKPNEITGWFSELDLVRMRRIVKYELGCLAQGNHEFNKYKLKYFKSMQYVKESLISDNAIEKSEVVDADGDIDMDSEIKEEIDTNVTKESAIEESKETDANVDYEDEDDDNGIITGEADEDALVAEESDSNENIHIDDAMEDEISQSKNNFDLSSANFQDIIARIKETDPSTAEQLQAELEGFVNINKI